MAWPGSSSTVIEARSSSAPETESPAWFEAAFYEFSLELRRARAEAASRSAAQSTPGDVPIVDRQ
jgi:hypothetical protein